jgi:hypothetical protein
VALTATREKPGGQEFFAANFFATSSAVVATIKICRHDANLAARTPVTRLLRPFHE